MKVTDYIAQAEKPLITFEIIPPLKGASIESIFEALDPLMEFKPPFIDVTYHREEYVYKQREKGLLERRTIRKRPGTVGICAAIMNRYQVDAVPHIICGGFTREETENALIDLNFLGVQNVLALRGDAMKSDGHFKPEADGHSYATELIDQIVSMNEGNYLDEDIQNSMATDFCIGVAGYPEKHYEAPNMDYDLYYLKQKVDKGASYIVTQLFYDNAKYFSFVEKCREIGINVPIIPGLKPIATKKHLTILPRIFHLDMPSDLVKAVQACKNNEEVRQVGVEWAIQQSKELIVGGAPCLHFYTMGKSDNVLRIAGELF